MLKRTCKKNPSSQPAYAEFAQRRQLQILSRPCLPELTGAGLTPPPGRVNIQEVMTVPVVATDGHSYELSAISDVFSVGNGQSPLTYANPHLPLPLPLTLTRFHDP